MRFVSSENQGKVVSPKSGAGPKRTHLNDDGNHNKLHSPVGATLYTVYKPMELQKPYLKWYPAREVMQRLVNRYMLLI